MLIKVGWKKDYVEKCVPVLPISGWNGDNLLKKSDIDCLLDVLNDMVDKPDRNTEAAMRLPISGVYKIKGVGDVLAGRVEQGLVKPGEDVVFLPTHTSSNPCG